MNKDYINNGFCLLKKNFYNHYETDRIEKIFDKIIKSKNLNVEINKEVLGIKTLAVKNFIDENLELKNLINKIFTDKNIINEIKKNIGENFKISDVVYRKSYPGDVGLDIHQDAEGENTIIINLSSVENCDGKTFFLKSSQRFKSIKSLINRDSISHRLIKISKFFFDFIDVSKGSILMFNNKVWHGRFPNHTKDTSSSLLIGIYKEGSVINYEENKNEFKKNKDKLDFNFELDLRRNLDDNKVQNKGSNSYYIEINSLEKYNKDILIKKKNFKILFFAILIKFIYFFKKV